MDNTITIEKNSITPYKAAFLIAVVLPLVVIVSLIITQLAKGAFVKPQTVSPEPVVTEMASAFAEVSKRVYSMPVRITAYNMNTQPVESETTAVQIEGQKVFNLKVIEVGVEQDGTMSTPKNWNEAGWYDRSSKAGEEGNVVINAHYDTNTGAPAAFWSLKNLGEGDKVSLTDEFGVDHTYQVFKVFYVDINDPSRLDIIKSDSNEKKLTLITCGGVWLPGYSTYSKRLVVQANYLN